MNGSVELLAPAGDFETALAAFNAGADAVYCGLSDFSARAFATNFSIEQLKDLVRYAHAHLDSRGRATPSRVVSRRVYVTFNTVIDEANFESAIERISRLAQTGVDGVIVQDLGIARICRKFFPELALHASTQLVAHNLEGVLALKEIGFSRVVLARELSLDEIRQIKQRCGDMELEVFIHGALCYSISGLCLYGAMEKDRSGNRGKCPYCCRQKLENSPLYPFSMKDLRLGEDVKKLADAGVASLKIEGRMKSPLYVASVVKWYRQFLGDRERGSVNSEQVRKVSASDLETVFSRRTTELLFLSPTPTLNSNSSPIDPDSLGHLGTPIGTVKRITRDREGRAWLRFHTMRALEKHDGLQFEALTNEGRHFGFGIQEMRQAISRAPVFEVAAGEDVEVLLPEQETSNSTVDLHLLSPPHLQPGSTVYCSMSNAVKRMFPVPSFRPSDYSGCINLDIDVRIETDRIFAKAMDVEVELRGVFEPAKSPEKTFVSVEKAFAKLGGTDYCLGKLNVVDPDRRFAPMSILNDLRRELIEKLDVARENTRQVKVDNAIDSLTDLSSGPACLAPDHPLKTVKIRADQSIPSGTWDEVIVAINPSVLQLQLHTSTSIRLSTPVWNGELEFNKLRTKVKSLIREGFTRWECSDLATLRLLKSCGVTDITADWTLYAFNGAALAELAEKGVQRFVASPENNRENLAYLAESGYAIEFLKQQSTPLFISLHEPASTEVEGLAIFRRDGLWITTRRLPRSFDAPPNVSTRIDLSFDPC